MALRSRRAESEGWRLHPARGCARSTRFVFSEAFALLLLAVLHCFYLASSDLCLHCSRTVQRRTTRHATRTPDLRLSTVLLGPLRRLFQGRPSSSSSPSPPWNRPRPQCYSPRARHLHQPGPLSRRLSFLSSSFQQCPTSILSLLPGGRRPPPQCCPRSSPVSSSSPQCRWCRHWLSEPPGTRCRLTPVRDGVL